MRTRFLSSSPMIVVARALLVALAAAAVVAGFALTRRRAPEPVASGVVYVCPMHPAVTSATPGECPICRMALEPQAAGAGAAGSAGGVPAEPPSLTLPRGIKLAGFDSVSRVKQFESSFDMRAWAWAESRDVGRRALPARPGRDAQAGRGGPVRARERSARPQPARDQGPPRRAGRPNRWDAATVLVRFRLDDHAGAAFAAEGDRLGQVRDPAAQRSGGAANRRSFNRPKDPTS